ncbi:MAG: phosphoenolpyruvate synthase regulatory protein [Candidatus Reconcilbacillus cellulovorans]|uniref:Putative pyruvate, phosphate dikinase regulatory protein n=1 Tax=Candidatus Reconcilbacillus cellulovorans TaxID=1906605 RepID=A0A2A6DZ38_9BACL|nr:MAG: phosphoenolpyruvate synthase regulatory protein [Candidatus Reconcilbacillus cellulovorans]
MDRKPTIYLCSDATGETAEAVTRAAARQFERTVVNIRRFGHVKHEDEVRRIVEEAAATGGFIAYTLVQPELRETMRQEAMRLGVRTVDILGPMLQAFVDTFHDAPKRRPGAQHELDEDYFRRIEAIEFAVKYDDGKDVSGFVEADVVLIGVSRTSKTPLSIFLAYKGLKVANLPLAPEIRPPDELFRLPSSRVVGLTMDAEALRRIRAERLKSLGLPPGAMYADPKRVREELEFAEGVMRKLGCRILDVTGRAIEETAAIILTGG